MPSPTEFQAAILVELNCPTDTVAQTNVSLWWSMNGIQSDINLQYLYTKKYLLSYLMGQARKFVNITTGFDQILHQQKFENLLDMMKILNDDIKIFDPYSGAATLQSTRTYNIHELISGYHTDGIDTNHMTPTQLVSYWDGYAQYCELQFRNYW